VLSGMETACGDVCRVLCGFLPRGWKGGGRPEASPEPAASGPH